MTNPDGTGSLVFIVENRGRQPVTIGAIGIAWDVEGDLPTDMKVGKAVVNNPWDRTLIPPGGSTQVHWPAALQAGLPIDIPLRPFAGRGTRTVYGRLNALFRILYEMDWRPDPPIPAEQLRPRDLIAKPLVAKWQLWQPSDLRSAQRAAWPAEIARERTQAFRAKLVNRERES
jgi:hypothetical protein